jgi:hypothetical protein
MSNPFWGPLNGLMKQKSEVQSPRWESPMFVKIKFLLVQNHMEIDLKTFKKLHKE